MNSKRLTTKLHTKKENLRLLAGKHEILRPLFRLNYKTLVSDATEIVIEGAPSSGNSFAVKAFQIAQRKKNV
jgi:hypothetical protein